MRVLIVEDFEDVARMVEMLVTSCGHEAKVALDGPSAVQAARNWTPELVLLDIGLPGMDGYEVAARLRDDLGLTHTKIVALSGFQPDLERHQASRLDGHFMKPITLKIVTDLLQSSEQ